MAIIIFLILMIPILFFLLIQVQKTKARMNQYPSKSLIEQGQPKRTKQLLKLVNFEIDTANRLLNNIAKKYPNMSIDWYFEKVIQDLERDRS